MLSAPIAASLTVFSGEKIISKATFDTTTTSILIENTHFKNVNTVSSAIELELKVPTKIIGCSFTSCKCTCSVVKACNSLLTQKKICFDNCQSDAVMTEFITRQSVVIALNSFASCKSTNILASSPQPAIKGVNSSACDLNTYKTGFVINFDHYLKLSLTDINIDVMKVKYCFYFSAGCAQLVQSINVIKKRESDDKSPTSLLYLNASTLRVSFVYINNPFNEDASYVSDSGLLEFLNSTFRIEPTKSDKIAKYHCTVGPGIKNFMTLLNLNGCQASPLESIPLSNNALEQKLLFGSKLHYQAQLAIICLIGAVTSTILMFVIYQKLMPVIRAARERKELLKKPQFQRAVTK